MPPLRNRTFVPTIATALLSVALCGLGAKVGAAAPNRWENPAQPGSQPAVTNAFNPPGHDWLSGHRGVDLEMFPGATVYAPGDGVVTFVGQLADRGVLVISHGELRTTYEPVVSFLHVGDAVRTGEAIGTISGGGHCSYECLHWGLKRGDEYLDPLTLLGLAPIVLKPIGDGSSVMQPRPTGRSGHAQAKASRFEPSRFELGSVGMALSIAAQVH